MALCVGHFKGPWSGNLGRPRKVLLCSKLGGLFPRIQRNNYATQVEFFPHIHAKSIYLILLLHPGRLILIQGCGALFPCIQLVFTCADQDPPHPGRFYFVPNRQTSHTHQARFYLCSSIELSFTFKEI
jgi:hypothetical protein